MTRAYGRDGAYLGVDIGTQGIRAAVWRNGELLTRSHYSLRTTTVQNGWASQRIEDIWDAFVIVVRQVSQWCVNEGIPIRGIGLDATASIMIVDLQGNPLTDVILWMDIRASAEAELISRLTHSTESAELPWPKALWLVDKYRDLFSQRRHIVEIADWIVWRLVGEWTRSEASAVLKWHGEGAEMLPHWAYNFDTIVNSLPGRVVATGETVGFLQKEVLGTLGFQPSSVVTVSAPIIDAYAAAVGSGSLQEGTMALILGTSTCELLHGTQLPVTAGLWGPFKDVYRVGLDVLEAGQPSTGSVVRWLEQLTGQSLDILEERSQAVNIGSEGVKMFPAFQGIRSPWPHPYRRGVFSGLTLSHHAPHLLRAIYEGTAVDIRRVMDEFSPGVVKRIVVSGGGIHSRLWLQIIAGVCAMPLEVSTGDAVTRGAALLAQYATEKEPERLTASIRWQTIAPLETTELYQKLYMEYLEEFPTYRP